MKKKSQTSAQILSILSYHILNKIQGFSGGPEVENLPCNAGDMSSIPGQGTKIPDAVEQLSQCATTAEPARYNQSLCATTKDPEGCN